MRDNNRLVSLGNNPEYDALLQCVGDTLEKGRQRAATAVNSAMVQTYW